MKIDTKEISLGLVFAACLGVLIWRIGGARLAPQAKGPDQNCGKRSEKMVMQDDWLTGVLDKGAKFMALSDWQGCHQLAKGDLVLYKVSPSHEPVVRILAGVPGDRFQLEKTKDGNSWTIAINGRRFMAGDQPYWFGSANPPALKLYQDSRNGVLDQSSVLLFSRRPPGDQDSGSLGALSAKDIVGVVSAVQ